ncbi:c-type cytochrome [Cognatishimia activa]|uniref:c-type cytochrome n=1 Tax=Cognatishimia activa TaxID=1715691 RepID=UPI00222F6189|nr:cytochrome c [Cognatishimia activa]UZD91974.1 cytochrome c [Cognatishimia activa]
MKTKVMITAALAIAMGAGVTFAGSHADPAIQGAIKARQGQMQLYAHNLGILGAMAKGEVAYDAAAASAAANNLKAVANLDAMTLWPQGSDMDSVEGTRAKAEIWTTFPAVVENATAMATAANAMADAAGKDLASLQAAMGPVGGACGSCHKAFRGK